MQARGVARRLVQGRAEVIEAHHFMKPDCQLMEQRGQIAVRVDSFRYGQQGLVCVVACASKAALVMVKNSDESPIGNQQVGHGDAGR